MAGMKTACLGYFNDGLPIESNEILVANCRRALWLLRPAVVKKSRWSFGSKELATPGSL
jgi:hypothetical protein